MNENMTLTLEGVGVIFANFAGNKGRFNAEGVRSFNVVLRDLKLAEELIQEGWAFKPLYDRDDEDVISAYHLNVKVNFESRYPPRVFKISPILNRKTQLGPDTVEMLDYLAIQEADLTLNGYAWEINNKSGVKAYLTEGFFVVRESELDIKYADLDEA